MNFLTNSEDANAILLEERGVPASSVVAEAIAPKMSEVDQKVVAFINNVVTPNCSLISPPPSYGASDVYNLLNQTVEKVCYGQMDAQTAAQHFFDGASKIMSSEY